MLVSSSRDASVCLPCHLRQVLRQLASQRAGQRSGFHRQRRSQSTDAGSRPGHEDETGNAGTADRGEDGDLKPRFSMGLDRPVASRPRKRREPRFKETTATLPISSMNRQTDIIVLRELPKKKKAERKEQPAPQPDQEKDTSSPELGLTAKEIQSLADLGDKRLSQAEVNVSIENSRFGRDEQIVTKRQFEAKIAELTNAYNLGQLRKYAASRQRSTSATVAYTPPTSLSHATSHSSATIPPETAAVSISPWTPIQTILSLKSKTSSTDQSRESAPRMSKQAFAKQKVAEDILRKCWGVEIENASTRRGQLEVHFTSAQLSLWTNSTSEALERLQPSNRFYRNSKLNFLPKDRLIRIDGPQAEAMSMAFTIREAFEKSSHKTIDLEVLTSLADRDSPLTDFADLFSPWQLRKVMAVTNTYLEYQHDRKKVHVSGFTDQGVRDAFRILLSLLPLPSQTIAAALWPEDETAAWFVLPTMSKKSLPFSSQSKQLGRTIEAVANNGKHQEKRASKSGKEAKKAENEDSAEISRKVTDETAEEITSRARQNAIVHEVLNHLPYPETLVEGEDTRKGTYWHVAATQMPWKAKLGHILQPTNSLHPTTSNSSANPTTLSPSTTFHSHFPANLSILKHLARLPDFRPGPLERGSQSFIPPPPIRPPTQLIAKLSPSPLTSAGALTSTMFPQIEMIFEQRRDNNFSSRTRSAPPTILEFRSMHAFLCPQQLSVHLPSLPTDLQFIRHQLLRSRYTQEDPTIAAFVSEILASARDTTSTLQAPSSLDVKVPPWAASFPDLEETKKLNKEQRAFVRRLHMASRDITIPYLFTGFEVRERRDFEIAREVGGGKERLRVESFSGGITGGSGIEVSVVAKKSVGVNAKPSPFVTVSLDIDVQTPIPMPAIFRSFARPAEKQRAGLEKQTGGVVRTAVRLVETVQRVWDGSIVVKPSVKRPKTREQQAEAYLKKKADVERRQREAEERGEVVDTRDVFEVLDAMDSLETEAGRADEEVGYDIDEELAEDVSVGRETDGSDDVEDAIDVGQDISGAEQGLGSRV